MKACYAAAKQANPGDFEMASGTPRPALTDDEIQKIAEEERLRFRLRSELDPSPKEKRSKLLTFLNSPFGLFLLTSVFLAGLTGSFAQIQSHARQIDVRNQDIIKLTTELKYRTSWFQHFSKEMKEAAPGNKIGASRFIWYTNRGGPENYKPSVPEFSAVTTYGLLSRLRLLGVTAGTDEALKSVSSLEYGQTQPDGNDKVYPQEFLDSQIQILSNYADQVLVPYLDRERHRSLLQEIFF
jgi:hypothetical protein